MLSRFFSDLKKLLILQVIMENDFNEKVERLLDTPYWVIDFLPMQVPQDSKGEFFAVEQYYLQEPQRERLCRQFIDVVLKLNCYHDLLVPQHPRKLHYR